jgi:AraC-like DNA-binding protein
MRAPEKWVAELCEELAALGFCFPQSVSPRGLVDVPRPLVDTYRALGGVLSRLEDHPSLDEVARALAISERQTNRRLGELEQRYGHQFSSWRAYLQENRVEWTVQLLSSSRIPLSEVARLAGYRSTAAMHHALARRGVASPGAMRKLLRARWA